MAQSNLDTNPTSLKDRLKGVNLYLIGMMGSGKTTTGQALATALGYRFVDTDQMIEQIAGQAVSQIFAQAGEPAFRQLETQVLSELASYRDLVVATGGGIVLEPMNWSYLHHGLVIWLNVALPDLVQRLAEDHTRPLLANSPLEQKLSHLFETRQALYAQADLIIAVQPNQSPSQVCQAILSQLPTIFRTDLASADPG